MLERLHPVRLTPIILAFLACRSAQVGARCMSRRLLGSYRTKRLGDGIFAQVAGRQKCLMVVSSLPLRQGENGKGNSWDESPRHTVQVGEFNLRSSNLADRGVFPSFSPTMSVTRESGNFEIERYSHLLVLPPMSEICRETQVGTCSSFALLHFQNQLIACPELVHAFRFSRPSVSG